MGSNCVDMTLQGFLPRYYLSSNVNVSVYSYFLGRLGCENPPSLLEIARDYIQIFDVEHAETSIVRIYTRMCNLRKEVNINVKFQIQNK